MTLNPALKRFLINPPTESGLIYDLSAIVSHAAETKKRLGSHSLLIAVKSLPDSRALEKLLPHIDGADISNCSEYKLIRESAEKSNSTLWLTRCPLSEFMNILSENKKCSIWYNVEDISDLPELQNLKQDYNFHISLRINTSEITDLKSRFGIERVELEKTIAQYGDLIEGIHLHHGSEKNDLALLRLFLDHLKKIQKSYSSITTFNVGGGWNLNDEKIISEIKSCDLNLTLEPGRYFGEDCGYAFSTITSIRKLKNATYLEGSLSPGAHLKWSNKMGHTLLPLGHDRHEISGPLYYGSRSCDESDRLELTAPASRKFALGDIIVFTGVSTYSLAWNHSFNGLTAPVYMLE